MIQIQRKWRLLEDNYFWMRGMRLNFIQFNWFEYYLQYESLNGGRKILEDTIQTIVKDIGVVKYLTGS